MLTKQFEKKTSLHYNNNRNYFRGRSQTAWGITETVTTGLGSLLAIDKFVYLFDMIITSSSLWRISRHRVINIDVSDMWLGQTNKEEWEYGSTYLSNTSYNIFDYSRSNLDRSQVDAESVYTRSDTIWSPHWSDLVKIAPVDFGHG